MAYTALQLITRAYYLSQVVSRELQIVTGGQVTDGLYLLNAILDFKGSDLREIPYYQEYIFNSVQGQAMYFVPNLLAVDTMTFNIGDVRYALEDESRVKFFGPYRLDGIQSLPYQYRMERTQGGMNVYIYFVPASIYVMKIWGKFAFTEVTLNTDMSLYFDPYYLEFLRHQLVPWICNEYGATVPDGVMKNLSILEKKVMDVSPPDLSLRNRNYFGRGITLNWAVLNLSGGWVP